MTDLTPLALRLSRYHAAGGWDAVAREVERMQQPVQQAARDLIADVTRGCPDKAMWADKWLALDAATAPTAPRA